MGKAHGSVCLAFYKRRQLLLIVHVSLHQTSPFLSSTISLSYCHQEIITCTHPVCRDLDDSRQIRDLERILAETIRGVPPSTPQSVQRYLANLKQQPEKVKEIGKCKTSSAKLTLPVGPRTPPAPSAALKRRSFQPEARLLCNRHTRTGRGSARRTRRETMVVKLRPQN